MNNVLHANPGNSPDPLRLRRCLTAFDLTMLGVGAIIGAGIFVLTGIAAATQAGPAIILSYLVAGFACGFAALAYAELAAMYGGCGGAYGYAYAGLGEFFGWLIGWDLLLEYGMDAAVVSIGWSGYFQSALTAMGIALPKALTAAPFQGNGGIINLPAVLIILGIATILSIGSKQSARFTQVMVYIKLFVIAIFIGIGLMHFNPDNWKPFMPFGPHGIINGAGLIFFAYIGFDAVATAGEETKNPQRDLPVGIIASLVFCTIIYVIVAGILTGIAYYPSLNNSSPVATALYDLGYRFSSQLVAIGAIAGLTTAILAMYYGFSRVFLAMSRDGLLPATFVKLDPKSLTPRRLIWSIGILMSIAAGFFPIQHIANLVNIGTLAAFIAVCGSVIILRKTQPHLKRPFKIPYHPVVPVLGLLLCGYLMSSLPRITWMIFGLWTAAGLVIYFLYGRINSLSAKRVPLSEPPL